MHEGAQMSVDAPREKSWRLREVLLCTAEKQPWPVRSDGGAGRPRANDIGGTRDGAKARGAANSRRHTRN